MELNNLKSKCAIVVNSCDAYEDVWALFFAALENHWPECDLEIYLNTESKTWYSPNSKLNVKSIPLVKDINIGWGGRLRKLLNNIHYDYIITLFDDFILEEDVDLETLVNCLKNLESNPDISAYYFLSIRTGKNISTDEKFEEIGKYNDYKINSAPAIWRKSDLLAFTGDNDNPWAWEYYGTARTYFKNKKFYCVKPEVSVMKYDSKMGGAIRRGHWVKDVVIRNCEKLNIDIDYSKRGFVEDIENSGKYTLGWVFNFILVGFKMVGPISFFMFIRTNLKRFIK
ncbi:hypothetical protein ABMA67_11120 [Halobacteriovorax sp. RZ-3]|uniref:hypothetical protein n=1 Tax=Halobacteriovorax sp. RZ-3 TaxID=3157720 RepID=UPI00371B2E79